jgi:hypothetical protein
MEMALRHLPQRTNVSVVGGAADATNPPAASASIVLGEAMLCMNTAEYKRRIAAEVFRMLRPGAAMEFTRCASFLTICRLIESGR